MPKPKDQMEATAAASALIWSDVYQRVELSVDSCVGVEIAQRYEEAVLIGQ